MTDAQRRMGLGAARRLPAFCMAPGLVFLVVLAAHLTVIGDFGATWDEPLHRAWGQIFLAFLRTGDIKLVEGMPGNGAYYGPMYHLLNYLVSTALYKRGLLSFVAANHVFTVVTFSAGCAVTFALARELRGTTTAALSVVFLVLMPPLVAHAHYNPKDIPLMVAFSLAMCSTYRCLRVRTVGASLLMGASAGLALAVKLSGIVVAPIAIAAYVVGRRARVAYRTEPTIRNELKLVFAACVGALASVLLLWPPLLIEPSLLARGFAAFGQNFWPFRVSYLGELYPGGSLPWHYTVFHLLAMLPVPTLISFVVGMESAIKEVWKDGQDASGAVLLSCWILVPLLFSGILVVVRYDGYRQFLFTLPAVAILAATGLQRVAAVIGRYVTRWRHAPLAIAAAIVATWALHDIWSVYPYTGSYFNQPSRWLLGRNLDRQVELEYWGATYKEGLMWLRANAEPGSSVCVPIAPELVEWYPSRDDLHFGCVEPVNYVMYFTRHAFLPQRYASVGSTVFEVRRYGTQLMVIRRKG